MYTLAGKFLAVSLCNGGGAGGCLAKCMFRFIAYGDKAAKPTVNDIHESRTKDFLFKILESKDEVSFDALITSDFAFDCLSQAGWTNVPCFENKVKLVGDLCQFFVIDKVRSVLEQFKEGLSTLNILTLITAHPRELETAFCYNPKTLTAMEVDTLFIPCFEEEGTHLRDKQEIMMMNWRDYLQDCEARQASATLEEVMIFATGASEIPAIGFESTPTIHFLEGDRLPKANTCGTILYLPLMHEDYDDFKKFMDFGILNTPGFGQP
ncbi:G2/M phase-specific E3 ubiquitin-protein ligase-like isoform X2 [Montipora foliosa]